MVDHIYTFQIQNPIVLKCCVPMRKNYQTVQKQITTTVFCLLSESKKWKSQGENVVLSTYFIYYKPCINHKYVAVNTF